MYTHTHIDAHTTHTYIRMNTHSYTTHMHVHVHTCIHTQILSKEGKYTEERLKSLVWWLTPLLSALWPDIGEFRGNSSCRAGPSQKQQDKVTLL